MQEKKIKGFPRNSFLLSLLLHLLLLLSISIVIIFKPEENKKPPHLYIPSYVYRGSLPSFNQHKSIPNQQRTSQAHENNQLQKDLLVSKNKFMIKEKATDLKARFSARKEETPKKTKIAKIQQGPPSMLGASLASLKANQMESIRHTKETEPILLVGDLNQVADPIIKLMGRSLSAHFSYPETEGMLGIKGKVIIELVLHPEGHFTNIRMLRSSQNQNLDAAALYAANTAPRVDGADRFLSAPTRFVVGFVFN